MHHTNKAFTLIELLAAIAIVGIAVVTLMHLNMTSIELTDHSTNTMLAGLIAQERISRITAAGLPVAQITHETVNHTGTDFLCSTKVSDLRQPNTTDLAPIRTVDVDISWTQTRNARHVHLTTYITERQTL